MEEGSNRLLEGRVAAPARRQQARLTSQNLALLEKRRTLRSISPHSGGKMRRLPNIFESIE
jgi:hypothetical protein